MDATNCSPYALTFDNYKFFKSFLRLAESPLDPALNKISFKDLIELISNNFSEFNNQAYLIHSLPILHHTLQLESKTSQEKIYVADFILKLLNKYNQSENDQQAVMQIYYQVLKSLPDQGKQFIAMTGELFETTYELLTHCGKVLAANILNCWKVLISDLKGIDWLKLLWKKVNNTHTHENLSHKNAQILIYFIDDFLYNLENFHKDATLTNFVLTHLVSSVREERKMAIYLLKKIVHYSIKRMQEVSLWEIDNSEQLNYSWNLYITVFENLEEKQSHLILPTLETIKNIKLPKIWLDNLYCQMLTHNNSLVLSWSIDYMLNHFVCSALSREVLKQFLQAANTTSLYNLDNNCLSQEKVQSFLNCNLTQFFIAFAQINWKSVPMHFWLEQLPHKQLVECHIAKETLIQIATRVRALQNKVIRGDLIEIFEERFAEKIAAFNIVEYFNLIDSLYNVSDSKVFKFSNLAHKIQIFSNQIAGFELYKRLYDIVRLDEPDDYLEEQALLMDIFESIPSEYHGCFRFMFIFDFKKTKQNIEFCLSKYKLNVNFSAYNNNLSVAVKTFVIELASEKAEELFVEEKTIDLFIKEITAEVLFSPYESSGYSVKRIIENGGKITLLHVCEGMRNKHFLPIPLFDTILSEVNQYDNQVRRNVYQCLFVAIAEGSRGDCIQLADRIMNNNPEDNYAVEALLDSTLSYDDFGFEAESGPKKFVHNIFHREVTHGDARVEEWYTYDKSRARNYVLHMDLANFITKMQNKKLTEDFFKYLLRLNTNISNKKPRYYENSHEHRIKMRIASCLECIVLSANFSLWDDSLWNMILNQNNQLNVTYVFERIIAYCAPNKTCILEKLMRIRNYLPGQQVSIIVITFLYYIKNWAKEEYSINEPIHELLPLTMGANFQVRTYAQLAVYKILKHMERMQCRKFTDLILLESAITIAIGDQLADLLSDIRLDNEFTKLFSKVAFYVTNVPFDEYGYCVLPMSEKYLKCKEIFAKKFHTTPKETNSEKSMPLNISNVQRKMNTTTDIKPVNNMISYPDFKMQQLKESQVIVVASLIDKLPNLGGIARTCEVLGIKKLVISSAQLVEKDDFQNLSMTAEKGLDITEVKPEKLLDFLIGKQTEGYEIVGAEQTANSKSFVDFHFPKRCIILLGHEKEGIPANILSILNHAVEIPQFGMVRSLNVHVTGALFMWEYCKQHFLST